MKLIIKNATIVNEGSSFKSDVLIEKGIIKKIASQITVLADKIIDANGLYLIPGIIDDQVHFREPGLTHKADIYTESKAAVAGGITSFMEMPNTKPQTLTQELLEEKFKIGDQKSLANFTFFMGASNTNLEEVLKTDPKKVGAIKIFMGSSTGNMLVNKRNILEKIFEKSKCLIAVHCEDENIIQKNTKKFKDQFGDNIPIELHPKIRSEQACYSSSSFAVGLAKKYNTRLHVFHLSTEKEIQLFNNEIPLSKKRITSEVCIHHLFFNSKDYKKKGTLIKWNPAIKEKSDQEALFQALLDNKIDVIATDHAPHTLKEKNNNYSNAPSGGPLVQHALGVMLKFVKNKKISIEQVVEKMCHNPAICFKIHNRGFIRENYYADLVLVDLQKKYKVNKDNILSKCNWSPFEDETLYGVVTHTIINGNLVYENGLFNESRKGMRLVFER
ncbi:MAG: dihydroorotase [Flavobacteriales bacterium]|nr:dihydroorotase [Flavobacteriales bacterium]